MSDATEIKAAVPEIGADQRVLLEDFLKAIPLSKADKLMGWRTGTARGAIERGEMRYIRFPGQKHMKVTPLFLTEWMQEYCTCKKPLLVGWDGCE